MHTFQTFFGSKDLKEGSKSYKVVPKIKNTDKEPEEEQDEEDEASGDDRSNEVVDPSALGKYMGKDDGKDIILEYKSDYDPQKLMEKERIKKEKNRKRSMQQQTKQERRYKSFKAGEGFSEYLEPGEVIQAPNDSTGKFLNSIIDEVACKEAVKEKVQRVKAPSPSTLQAASILDHIASNCANEDTTANSKDSNNKNNGTKLDDNDDVKIVYTTYDRTVKTSPGCKLNKSIEAPNGGKNVATPPSQTTTKATVDRKNVKEEATVKDVKVQEATTEQKPLEKSTKTAPSLQPAPDKKNPSQGSTSQSNNSSEDVDGIKMETDDQKDEDDNDDDEQVKAARKHLDSIQRLIQETCKRLTDAQNAEMRIIEQIRTLQREKEKKKLEQLKIQMKAIEAEIEQLTSKKHFETCT